MSEYYAVTRSGNTLQHYGIKGMRWGVRKAIESGNQRRLAKQFRKAQKKLFKLNAKADADFQKELAKKHNNRAKAALGVSAVGLGGIGAVHLANKKATDILTASKPRSRKKKIVGEGKDFKVGEALNQNMSTSQSMARRVGNNELRYGAHPGLNEEARQYINSASSSSVPKNSMKTIRDISTAVGIAGLGAAAYQKARAMSAKRRSTGKVHAKAVAKRDAWRNEMAKVFAGTQYAIRRKHK